MDALFATVLALTPFFASRPLLAMVVGGALAGALHAWTERRAPTAEELMIGAAAGALAVVLRILFEVAKALLKTLEEQVRERWRRVEALLMATFATFVAAGMLFQAGLLLVDEVTGAQDGALQPAEAGLRPEALVLVGVFVLTLIFALLRGEIRSVASLLPGLKESGAAQATSLFEAVLVVLGVFIAFLFPVVGLVLMASLLAASVGIALTLRAETIRRTRRPCVACQKPVHRSALSCPFCRTAQSEPASLGLLGMPRADSPMKDLERHRVALLSRRLCAACAEPLIHAGTASRCGVCERPAFEDSAAVRAFCNAIDKHFFRMLPVLALVSAIPVVGMPAGLVIFRWSTGNALSRYGDWHGRIGSRILRGIALLAAFFFAQIPLVGAVLLPIVAVVNHVRSRRALLGTPVQEPEPLAAAAA